MLFSLGHEKRLCQSYLADGIVTVITGVILVLAIGPVGAPLGSIIGVMVASLPMNLTVLIRAKSTTPVNAHESVRSVALAVRPDGASFPPRPAGRGCREVS